MGYLTVALMKGRLAPKTMELLEKVDTTCEGMKGKSFGKLIFVNEELGVRFFLTKTNDVSTYMEYGTADTGVSGKDTVLEEERKLYEVPNLDLRRCRMCVCEPGSARELLQHHEIIRMATKYPGTARDCLYNKKHQTVEIIRLNGSIELAPIVELSEVIVGIVGTGSILRENGLTVLEEVCGLPARVTINQVSMKRENGRITKLTHDLREMLAGEDVGRQRKA